MRPPEESLSPHNRVRGGTHLLLCSSFPCRGLSVVTSFPAPPMPCAAHTDRFAFCYRPAPLFLVPGSVARSSLPAPTHQSKPHTPSSASSSAAVFPVHLLPAGRRPCLSLHQTFTAFLVIQQSGLAVTRKGGFSRFFPKMPNLSLFLKSERNWPPTSASML